MSELKTYKMIDEKYCTDCVCVIPSEFYLKSEADHYISELIADQQLELDDWYRKVQHNKYKRCLAMAKWCHSMWILLRDENETKRSVFYWRWWNLWNELAEKLKEADDVLMLLKK